MGNGPLCGDPHREYSLSLVLEKCSSWAVILGDVHGVVFKGSYTGGCSWALILRDAHGLLYWGVLMGCYTGGCS